MFPLETHAIFRPCDAHIPICEYPEKPAGAMVGVRLAGIKKARTKAVLSNDQDSNHGGKMAADNGIATGELDHTYLDKLVTSIRLHAE